MIRKLTLLVLVCAGCSAIQKAANDIGSYGSTLNELDDLQKEAVDAARFENKPDGLKPVLASTSASIGTGAVDDVDSSTKGALLGAGEMLHLALSDIALGSRRFQVPSDAQVRTAWQEKRGGQAVGVAEAGTVRVDPQGREPHLVIDATLNYVVVATTDGDEVNLINPEVSYSNEVSGSKVRCSVRVQCAENGIALCSGEGVAEVALDATETTTMIDDWKVSSKAAGRVDRVDRSHTRDLLRVATRKAVSELLKEYDPLMLERQSAEDADAEGEE